MKVLITGITGFVGPYLKKELEDAGYNVQGLSRKTDNDSNTYPCDLTKYDEIHDVIEKTRPELIFHLAGFSSVSNSFETPELCFDHNVNGTKNLLDAIKATGINPTILLVSSSEIYGKPAYLPMDESHPIKPLSPYAKSKVEQERLAIESGLKVIIARAFNHTGPTQKDTFVIPSIRKQISEAQNGESLLVGNIDIIRDFSDVRDVVRAYRLLAEMGSPGECYNVSSGKAYSLRYIAQRLIRISGKNLVLKLDPTRLRKVDNPVTLGNPRKLNKLTNHHLPDILSRL